MLGAALQAPNTPQPLQDVLFWKPTGPKSHYGTNRYSYLNQLVRDVYDINASKQADYESHYPQLRRDICSPAFWKKLITRLKGEYNML